MEIASAIHDVHVQGSFKRGSFVVDQNRHMFEILSSGLYSDKAKAIVRELTCNAWDAHVEVGKKDTPFIVYLPNRNEPFFKIRDFGPGLSPEDILGTDDDPGLYRRYGASTKQRSNDQIGCFGLGSKSPFAYTKNWNVVSYFNGTKYTYTMMVAENGVPDCVQVGVEDTDEPNGMEVFFAVKNGDHNRFYEAAEKVLRVFDTLPEVKGYSRFEIPTMPEALLEGDGWKVYRGNLPYGLPRQIAVMGNVEYPLVIQDDFSPNAKAVMSLPIWIRFPIGSFEVTPSRETISWTESSIQKVNDYLELIYDELTKMVNDQISGCPTMWEAKIKTWELLNSSGLQRLSVKPTWHNQVVLTKTRFPAKDTKIMVQQLTSKKRYRDNVPTMACSTQRVTDLPPVETEFFLADFRGAPHRVAQYVRDFEKEGQSVYLIDVPNQRAFKEVLHTIGISSKQVRLASSIPKKQRAATSYAGGGSTSKHAGTRSKVFKHNGRQRGNSDKCWDQHTVEMNDGGVYVQIHRFKVVGVLHTTMDSGLDASDLGDVMENLRTLGIAPAEIVGIKTQKIKKFKDHPKWIGLQDYIQQEMLKLWQKDSFLRVAYWHYCISESDWRKRNELDEQRKLVAGAYEMWKKLKDTSYPKDHPESKFVKYMTVVSKVVEKRQKAHAVMHLNKWWVDRMTLVTHTKGQNRTDYRGLLLKHYPFLGVAEAGYNSWSNDDVRVHLLDYVKFMDGLRAQGVMV